MAVVIGSTSVKSRNEKAADLLAKGFSQPTAGQLTLAAMKPSGAGLDQATNMREALCTKAGSQALRKKERELAAKLKKEGKPEPASYLAKRDGPRDLVPVSDRHGHRSRDSGGCRPACPGRRRQGRQGGGGGQETGRHRVGRGSEHSAACWRPDMPAPEGAEPTDVGDSAALEPEAATPDAELSTLDQ